MSQALCKQWQWFSFAILWLQRNKRNDFPAALIERSLQFNMTVRKEEQTAQTQNLKCFDRMLRGRRGNGSTL